MKPVTVKTKNSHKTFRTLAPLIRYLNSLNEKSDIICDGKVICTTEYSYSQNEYIYTIQATDIDAVVCTQCRGTGNILHQTFEHGLPWLYQDVCPKCNGKGNVKGKPKC